MMALSSSAPGGKISISATTKKLQVDNRIALRFYFRIADNILKQADIFREEKNIVDLYVMLLRFSSLVSETIPLHRDYRASQQNNKLYLRKKLEAALTELEELKPDVEAKLEELQSKQIFQQNKPKSCWSYETQVSSVERPAIKQLNWNDDYLVKKPVTREFVYQGFNALSSAKPVEEHFRRISLSILRPKEETLSKHSILGPNGLRGQWQPPSNLKVQYPSNLDFIPPQIPRDNFDQQSVKDEIVTRQEDEHPEKEKSSLEHPIQLKSGNQQNQDFDSLISFETEDDNSLKPEVIAQPSPPPILAEVQDLILPSTCATETEHGLDNVSDDAPICTEDPLQLHIPTKLMDTFMKLAKSNTSKNLETCGVLAGSLKNRKFYITALIVPKQESTSDSCQTTNEEEIFEVQDKQSLFPLGWIHTHPTQSCFMSSIDVHTHYSYQIMLPEAIAIVMAPRDSSRNHGIFRLTPGGMTVIRQCPRRGFHSHDPSSDGSPIYRQCTDVYMNSTLKFDIIDLR